MAFHIAVAGKGGTGKTTLCSLIVRQLIKAGKKPILAVDADANANLNEALGLEIEGTISEVLARIYNNLDPLPAGMTKDQYVAFKVHESLAEGDNVDLLVMGGPEGAGCYCYANNILRGFVAELSNNYPYLIMDNEAGLEHLSRRTTQNVDVLFITSDASARGIRSAGRIRELVEALKLDMKKMYLVVSRVKEGSIEALMPEIEKTGLELIGAIPTDDQVMEYDLLSKPLISLPDHSPAVAVVDDILKKAAIV
ncbi:MAG TPA: carbon monoxide dehydrogenase [Desulfotomaculum sp.]|nr:MAG: carbon monoxide dehydrogenase [Desulfotomaculum sp. BICA1-6]HBX24027.1 carbon monoxide dehydrogenase [Desulfotomaculum sp.]